MATTPAHRFCPLCLVLWALVLFPLGVVHPAQAQILAVDVAVLHTEVFTEPVVELYAAAAPVGPVRPYVIASWTLDEADPVFITQVALPLYARGPFWASLDAGATWYPFNDYEPEPSVSTFLGYRLPVPDLYLFAIPSLRPFEEDVSLVAGVGYTLLFRR